MDMVALNDTIMYQAKRVKKIKKLVKETLELAELMNYRSDQIDRIIHDGKALIRAIQGKRGEFNHVIREDMVKFITEDTKQRGTILTYYDLDQILDTI